MQIQFLNLPKPAEHSLNESVSNYSNISLPFS